MRAIIDIPQLQINQLTQLCAMQNISRAQAIREAIALYIQNITTVQNAKEQERQSKKQNAINSVFGIWEGEDGLKYQQNIRAEWE
jgi:hypothetical protein